MDARYERNFPALTEREWTLLRSKKAAVIGCGGLGGYLIEYLSRIGVGFIRAVDGDVFDRSNGNRQLLCTAARIGGSKAAAAAARVREIGADTEVEAVEAFLDDGNALSLIRGCDVVLDGLDGIPARKSLAKACAEAGVPYVYGAVSGWVAQAGISMPGDGLIEGLYPSGTQPRDSGILSFTPALCASLQAALCVKLLVGRPVETGRLFWFDLLEQEFAAIPLT